MPERQDSESAGWRATSEVLRGERVPSDQERLETEIIDNYRKAVAILKAREEGGQVGGIDWTQYLSQPDSELSSRERELLQRARADVKRFKSYNWGPSSQT